MPSGSCCKRGRKGKGHNPYCHVRRNATDWLWSGDLVRGIRGEIVGVIVDDRYTQISSGAWDMVR